MNFCYSTWQYDNPKYIPVTYFQVYIYISQMRRHLLNSYKHAHTQTEKYTSQNHLFPFTKYAYCPQFEIYNSDILTHDTLQQTTYAQLQL